MLLLIPGPVTTDPRVREAAAHDYAPWDLDFRALYASVRERVLALAGGRPDEHVALALQGCGHFMVEAAVRTLVPRDAKLLVPLTGQYADRLIRLASETGRQVVGLPVPDDQRTDPEAVQAALEADPAITHVAAVYSETSSGICHDIPALARATQAAGRRMIVDAVSAFGALPLDIGAMPAVDAVVFTANKCIEGLPGLAFAVARQDSLAAAKGRAESWSFDLADLMEHAARAPGSFRFTPPAQAVAAFNVALDLHAAEGGAPARLARYSANLRALVDGARGLGLSPTLPASVQGPIVCNIDAPADPNWDLQRFVDALKRRGVLISNFYNTPHPSIRVGCIGHVTPDDMRRAVAAMGGALDELDIATRIAA